MIGVFQAIVWLAATATAVDPLEVRAMLTKRDDDAVIVTARTFGRHAGMAYHICEELDRLAVDDEVQPSQLQSAAVILATEKASAEDKATLARFAAQATPLSAEQAGTVKDIVAQYNGVQLAQQLCQSHINLALDTIAVCAALPHHLLSNCPVFITNYSRPLPPLQCTHTPLHVWRHRTHVLLPCVISECLCCACACLLCASSASTHRRRRLFLAG